MKTRKISYTVLTASSAFVLWTLMFCPLTHDIIPFWPMMTVSAIILTCFASFSGVKWWKNIHFTFSDILLGILSGAVLWGIFWIGDRLSSLMFDFARPQVDLIYTIKDGYSPWLIGAMLLCLFGPAEEIFWRGFIQQSIADKIGSKNAGLVIGTLIYAVIHAPSMNFMLVMAALVAGLFWGLFYRLYPERLGAIIISHAVWDVAVFLIFPI